MKVYPFRTAIWTKDDERRLAMAHLELIPGSKRVSTQTLDVKPNPPITIGVYGHVEGLRLLATAMGLDETP